MKGIEGKVKEEVLFIVGRCKQSLLLFMLHAHNVPTMIKFNQPQLNTFSPFSILFPPLVRGDCTCELENEDRNKALALKYKMAAIVSILVASAIGVCFPLLGKTILALYLEKDVFFVIKAFAACVILLSRFIHVLPDATENFTSHCLDENPWWKFLVCPITTLLVDTFATSHYTKSHRNITQQAHGDQEKRTEENEIDAVHVHTHASSISISTQLLRYLVSQVLELRIVIHSVIIGTFLGASKLPKTIKLLRLHSLFISSFKAWDSVDAFCSQDSRLDVDFVILLLNRVGSKSQKA